MNDRSDDIDDTVVRPRGERTPVAADADTDSDDTIIRLVEPAPRRRTTTPSAEALLLADVPEVQPAIAWGMRVRGTTTVVPLDVPVIIGRRPGAARPTEIPAPRRLVIPADRADVSARHARVEQLGESLVVSDLGSTNGVVVHWSSGAILRLRPAESCAVLPDAIIGLGDGVEIEFVAPTSSHTPRPSEPL